MAEPEEERGAGEDSTPPPRPRRLLPRRLPPPPSPRPPMAEEERGAGEGSTPPPPRMVPPRRPPPPPPPTPRPPMAEEERGAGEGSTPPPPPPVLLPCRPPPPPPYPPTPRSPMAEEERPPHHKRGPAISSGHGPPVPFQAQRAWADLRRSLLSPSVAAAGLEEGHLSAGLRFLPPSEEEGPSSTSVAVAEEEGPPPPSSSFSPAEDDHPHRQLSSDESATQTSVTSDESSDDGYEWKFLPQSEWPKYLRDNTYCPLTGGQTLWDEVIQKLEESKLKSYASMDQETYSVIRKCINDDYNEMYTEVEIHNGLEWMREEVIEAFKTYISSSADNVVEFELEDLCQQCLIFDSFSMSYHHYNFLVKSKSSGMEDWVVRKYFAEVKLVNEEKHYFCCPLQSHDEGHCYGCQNVGIDIKHPKKGGYEKGHVDSGFPFDDI